MDATQFNRDILLPLKRWAPLGEMVDEFGTRHIGHIFKDAPFGYMHQLHSPAEGASIAKAEQLLGKPLPKQFKAFLSNANGASFYNPSGFHVCGILQDAYLSEYESRPWRFPIDIIRQNEAEWLKSFPDGTIVIGRDDGTNTDIVALEDGRILEYDALDPNDVSSQWSNFDEWLISEFQNLYVEHDDAGELLEISGTMH